MAATRQTVTKAPETRVAATSKVTSPLASLMATAMSLPAFAASQPAQKTLAVSASLYEEDAVDQANVIVGSNERYDIKIGRFYLNSPLAKDW